MSGKEIVFVNIFYNSTEKKYQLINDSYPLEFNIHFLFIFFIYNKDNYINQGL